jgi:serine/threonine protein kinase
LELLKIMEGIHAAGIVHQDLKPHNIMRKDGKLFIIDFGLARQLSTDKSKSPYVIKGFIGTPRYASVRAHNMFEQGKKDDLESLFYNIAYFYYQRLPWSKLHVATETKLERIKMLKVRHHETLFLEMPVAFQQAFQYITALSPFADPDYTYLTGLFRRTRTLILHNDHQQRTATKRASLNLQNFLQVPDSIYELKVGRTDEEREGNRSSRSFGMASDAILSEYLEFEEDNKENYCEGDNIEPTLPEISKFFQNIVLRNPFSS